VATAIEWTDETWNPVTGCTKVSEGCDHCYAERITERFHGKGSFERIVLHEDRILAPLHWRKPRMVFVNSMSDLFHDAVPDEYIAKVFAVMAESPWHTFQVLTKRPGRMVSLLGSVEFRHEAVKEGSLWLSNEAPLLEVNAWSWPLENVWLGTSVENQRWADIRIPKLLQTPGSVRFLSCEPLLGPIDLGTVPIAIRGPRESALRQLDWVIVGGESGPGARPMNPDWARSLRDQCVSARVAYFFKQWGGPTPKFGGRVLDGRMWDEMPAVSLASPAIA
jgi:protein gp37